MEEESAGRLRAPPPPCLLAIANQNDNGLLLHGLPREQSLRAGELLLTTPPGQPENARLAIVRWISLRADGREIECGVEFIAPRHTRCWPCPASPTPVTASSSHCGWKSGRAHPLLLMAGRPYSQLREFHLRDGEQETLIRVSRLHLQTPLFQIMEYRNSNHF